MRIRILGAGWYGCHLAVALLHDGHDVEVHERKQEIFGGASGRIPARLHTGAHYPRSHQTRTACQRHTREFMEKYGFLTRGVPVNIYAIADKHSYIDFDQYLATLRGEFEFITVHDPLEFGLLRVEGAILTPERHILADMAKTHFEQVLKGRVVFGVERDEPADGWDLTIDCTFCANSAAGVDRYEPCLVVLLEGPTDTAVTIMDGPFGSLYPWDPGRGLNSLSSARYTPFAKDIRSYEEAQAFLDGLSAGDVEKQAAAMFDQMRMFYPAIDEYKRVENMLSIRAMPLSGADTRLVDVRRVDSSLFRVRAGKIDAVLDAEKKVRELLAQ